MMILITAALVASQPAPVAHAPMPPMDPQKHEAMAKKCCCDDMAKGEHDKHAADTQPQGRPGR